ncbi:MAG: TonB-dependent receptor [Roseburia sp.]|nr:TonB-dependent receptor [Roseburia sp.]MCM1440107.1 TonB-dependent receptor [Roseburia sp.]
MKLSITLLLLFITVSNLHCRNVQPDEDSLTVLDKELPEVRISARKKLVRITPGGLEYNMKDDRTASAKSLIRALRNVPLVTVDGMDNVRISGSESFRVYLNGKPFKLADTNRKEALRSIPANRVKSVEIITHPDARYDADAGTAVLNIITEKDALDGCQIGITGEGDTTPKANGGVSVVASKGKCNFLLGYNYDFTRHTDQPVYVQREAYNDRLEKISTLNSESRDGRGDYHNHLGHGIMEIEMDSLNLLYADAHVLLKRNVSEDTNRKTFISGKCTEYSRLKSSNDFSSGAFEGNLIYRRLYKNDKSEMLSLGYRYSYNPDRRYDTAEDSTAVIRTTATDIVKTRIDTKSEGGLNEHTLMYNLRIPLKLHTLIMGGKVILRRSSSTPSYRFWDYESMNWVNNVPYGNEVAGKMRQLQDVVSAYATYNLKAGQHIDLNVGGRYEYSHDRIKFADNPVDNLYNTRSDFMPRGSLSYTFSSRIQATGSYSMGIIRPSIWTMNPYRSQQDAYNASYGTPNLKTEHKHIANASLMYNGKNIFANFKVEYIKSNDAVMEYPSLEEDSRLLCLTYTNIDRYEQTGISLYVGYTPFEFLSFNVGGDAAYHSLNLKDTGTMHCWRYNIYAACNANIGTQWTLGCNYGLFHQPPSFRSYYNSLCMYSFYAYRQFCGNRLNIGVTINNPFEKYNKSRHDCFGDNFRNIQYNYIKMRSLCVSVSYNFGKGKQVDIRRNISMRNSDMNENTGVER